MVLAAWLLSGVLALPDTDAVQFAYDRWGTREGLPQSSVTAILQTRDGYLWLGTQGGLVRFDGVRFTLFAPATHPGLRSSRIRALFEDRRHTLWIGTEDGGLIAYAGGRFTPFSSADLRATTVSYITAARDDGLWVGTPAGLFEIRAGAARRRARADGSPLTPESHIVEDESGGLWIGTRWGLVHYSPDRVSTYTTADGLPHDAVQALLKARDGSLWVGTRRGLARWTNGAVQRVYARELAHPEVLALHEDPLGHIWVGTRAGLSRIANGVAAPLRSTPAMVADTVVALAGDREGNVWAGMNVNGLARVKTARVTMLRVADTAAAAVVPITEDRDGTMWIGGTCAGLLRYRHGQRRLLTRRDGLPEECIWSLLADRDGALWIGTWGGGLLRMANGRIDRFTHRTSGLRHDVVLALFQDRRGVVWIGTQGGLHGYDGGVFTAYTAADGLVHDDVRYITEDRHGALWVGTTNGVSRFAGGRFTNFTTANGLRHDSVRAIHEDADGTIWIGTYGGGLTRLRGGRLSHITHADGLFDDVVSRILEDDRGFLWMSGNRGIFRVSRDALNAFADGRSRSVTSVSYGVGDGMTNHETNGGAQPAGWRSRDGRLWFPTLEGAAVVDPHGPDLAPPPPMAIERVAVDDGARDLTAPVVLPSGRTRLEIGYTALSLSAPDKSRFRYQLEGFDDVPVEAGTRRVAYYTNLPPGRYRFRATGSNHDGVWNAAGATLDITVTAPFWMTWWFRTTASLGVALIAFVAHRARVGALHRRQRLHAAFTRQLIESQEAERARIARELHDTLGQSLILIKNQAQLGLRQPPEAGATAMDDISAMAARAITEVKEIAYDLRPYQLDRLGLTRALESLTTRVAGSTALAVAARIENVDGVLSKDAEITVYRIVQESLSNVLTHARATAVDVAITRHHGHVCARVEDDGVGFVVETATLEPRGMGLSGMAERAAMLGARLEIVSRPGHGTTVILNIPEPADGR